ncbi:MAG: phosphodiester glycosidase family protein [Spirochaetales bacterium]
MTAHSQTKPYRFRGAATRFSENRHPDGQITLYETVFPPQWSDVRPVQGITDAGLMSEFLRLFRVNILPGKHLEGPLVLFTVPEGLVDPFPWSTSAGRILDQDCRIRYWLSLLSAEDELSIEGETLRFKNGEYQEFWNSLVRKGLTIVPASPEGKANFLPVYRRMCKLSRHGKGRIVCNSSYFQMEISDCGTMWDVMGSPIGFFVLGGETILPPLFGREALVIGVDGASRIEKPTLEGMPVRIGNEVFLTGKNCEFFFRPDADRTPEGKAHDLVIVGTKLLGINEAGGTEVPEGGFVIRTGSAFEPSSATVEYPRFDDILLAIQAGPALVVDGKPVQGFGSPFWSGTGPAFPPTVYPLNWKNDRAARLGLGSKDGKPIVIWVEGSSKLSYMPGLDSCGASLSEFADICAASGVENMLNLDGGGSAQLCIDGRRRLRLSDRRPDVGCDAERPVPLGISFGLEAQINRIPE